MTDKECIEWLEAINRDRDREGASTVPIEFAIRAIRDRAAFTEAWERATRIINGFEDEDFPFPDSCPGCSAMMDSLDPRKKADDDT